jgi:cysteinyl-tRNA synthetase
MIELIGRLVAGGHAYPVEGVVYFDQCFAPYGRLSGKNLDDLPAGARRGVDERKRDPRGSPRLKGASRASPRGDSPWDRADRVVHRMFRDGDEIPGVSFDSTAAART